MKVKEIEEIESKRDKKIESKSGKCDFVRVKLIKV